MRVLRSKLPERYGPIENGVWANEQTFMRYIDVPQDLCRPMGHNRIYCNIDIAEPLTKALQSIVNRGLTGKIHSFDGCFNIRPSRSNERQSVHSWGMAVDINADTNKLGEDGDMAPEIVACFKEQNFVWGGDWHHKDPMHLQYVTED